MNHPHEEAAILDRMAEGRGIAEMKRRGAEPEEPAYFAAEDPDDGLWYVYSQAEIDRNPMLRNPCIAMMYSEWLDGGKETAQLIATYLSNLKGNKEATR